MRRPWIALAAAALTAGCLDPLVSDQPSSSGHVLPSGTEVPLASDNPDLARQIRVGDGLSDSLVTANGGLIPLRNGYAKGAPVKYWDLGDAPQTFAQLYIMVIRDEADGETLYALEQPPIAEGVPGDTGYSPFLLVQYLPITRRYAGQILASREAVSDALDMGIVEEAIPSGQWIDGPIVADGVKLDNGSDQKPTETFTVFANGYRVNLLPVGGNKAFRKLASAGRLPRGDAHRVTVGNAVNPVNEPTFQNPSANWTPAVRIIECKVTAIDPPAPVTDEKQLFTRDNRGALSMATDRVRDWTITTSNKHWPLFEAVAP